MTVEQIKTLLSKKEAFIDASNVRLFYNDKPIKVRKKRGGIRVSKNEKINYKDFKIFKSENNRENNENNK